MHKGDDADLSETTTMIASERSASLLRAARCVLHSQMECSPVQSGQMAATLAIRLFSIIVPSWTGETFRKNRLDDFFGDFAAEGYTAGDQVIYRPNRGGR